jgi:hypothetical protein|tara:strand:- start:3 stop:470 length:468 start_codon:yes stop_codon:yes gene_type:complete
MKASELAVILSEMHSEMDLLIDQILKKLEEPFKASSTNNEETANEIAQHLAMGDYLIMSGLNSKFKKEVDAAKKELDRLSIDPDGVAGQTKQMFSSNCFTYSKKQNRDGETTLVVDLVTALARAGVPKEQVDEALKAAKKAKKGNTYYQVTTTEE